jgi:hypothetical protein
MVVLELSAQVTNGGMARMQQATQTLAAFGLAWGLVSLMASFLSQVKQLGLVLVSSQAALRTAQRFVLMACLLMAGVLVLLALGPVGDWVVYDLHGVDRALGATAREALLWLVPVPVLRGLSLFYTGLLLRMRRTGLASAAALAGTGASILAVFALLPAGFVQQKPIWLPVLVTHAGLVAELGVVLWGYGRYRAPLPEAEKEPLSYSYVYHFYWPLALIMGIQGFSRPLINLFVSREPEGPIALAILTVVYALAHVIYGWVNEIRNLAPAFRDQEESLARIRPFAAACGLLSFVVMVVLFWTPLRDLLLQTLIGLEPELAARAATPLKVFCFFPLVVMVRAYYHGLGLLAHRTKAMAPSAPARVTAILVALVVLPLFGVQGATRGVTALLCGFVCETVVVRLALTRNRGASG